MQHRHDIGTQNRLDLDRTELSFLCRMSKRCLLRDSTLLQLTGPIHIIGDLHGNFGDLVRFVETFGFPSDTCLERYLFLGDYVDRGDNSIETIVLLLCMKVIFPTRVFLLRGNHESKEMTETYGFRDDCIQNYDEELWREFLAVFDCLPLAALVGGRIYCVHGGLSPALPNPFDLDEITRPHQLPDAGPTLDILWSDPSRDTDEFVEGDRGASWKFGQAAVKKFLDENDFDFICRAHECVDDGLAFPFDPEKIVVTVFSATDYGHFFHNKGAMLNVSAELKCSPTILAPTI